MSDISYKPLVEDMTFSYSRLKAFQDCPYRWYLQYIRQEEEGETFFASFGRFVHELIARKLMGESADSLVLDYLTGFRDAVRGPPPSTSVFNSFFRSGLEAVQRPLELDCKILLAEDWMYFHIDEMPFRGIVDVVGQKEDGSLVIVDHKSRNLKPRSGRKTPTKTDEELDEYLRQLYLYAIPLSEIFGSIPDELVFHCYRTGEIIREPFSVSAFEEARQWALDIYHKILEISSFPPDVEYFKCSYLCGQQKNCEYYDMNFAS